MNCCCENCGWTENADSILRPKYLSSILCNYSGHRTWADECCDAWKPKNTTDDKDMAKVVRCKDCVRRGTTTCIVMEAGGGDSKDDWFCADGERR